MLWQLALLLIFLIVLTASAQLVIRDAAALAHRFGLTSFLVGFLLLGILTSLPEIFVAIGSAVNNVPQLAMGNLLGGSILLLSLVVGVSSLLLGKISLEHGFQFSEVILIGMVIASPAVVLWDGRLSRIDGILLVGVYMFHAFLLNNEERQAAVHTRPRNNREVGHMLGGLAVGFVGMAIASRGMIGAAQVVGSSLGIAPFVFGLVLLSLGTNLPEFALAFEGAVLRRKTLAFGDFLGSAAANTLILGVLGVLRPFDVTTGGQLWFSLGFLGMVTAFFVWALSTKREISRIEGIGLLGFYGIFVALELWGWH